MPVYVRKIQSTHQVFQDRETTLISEDVTRIPVPNHITLCNGCNNNNSEGYLVYLGKRELKANRHYDYYCEVCMKKYFKGYKEV